MMTLPLSSHQRSPSHPSSLPIYPPHVPPKSSHFNKTHCGFTTTIIRKQSWVSGNIMSVGIPLVPGIDYYNMVVTE